MSTGRGVTGAQDIAQAEATAQARTNNVSHPQSKQPSSFLSLPRELRDFIYELHMPTAYSQSRPLDPDYQLKGIAQDNFLSVREDWRNKHNLDLYCKELYEPVYHEYNMGNTGSASAWLTRNSRPDHQAREHSIPSLMLLDHPIQIAREARDLYIGQKLYVNVDSINWFQTWCSDLPEQDCINIRRLHIGCRARILPSQHGRKTRFYQHSRHCFTLRLSDDKTLLTISSRFKLTSPDLALLRSNLSVLLAPKLQPPSPAQDGELTFDGKDILDALSAFHYKRASRERKDMVVGSFFKKLFWWEFECGEGDSQLFEQLDRLEEEVELWAERVPIDSHVLLRFRAGEGAVEI